MTANPIYLLDFRQGRVLELDPGEEVAEDETLAKPESSRSARPEVVFTALGSPVKNKD